MNSLAGHLLIAPPHERDLDFIRTVILLIQHSEEQAVGVVLNRPTTITVKEAWRGKGRCQCDGNVYSGGPVAEPLMALHTDESLGEIEILSGVYYSAQVKHLQQVICGPTHPCKIFSSHCGWGPGELERFLATAPWQILPATPSHVFHDGPGLWEEVSKVASSG
jgi:putative transcriptional regulator